MGFSGAEGFHGGGSGGGLTSVTTNNTTTFSFYGDGTGGNPLCGCPILSACANQGLIVCPDGLFVPASSGNAVILLGAGTGSSYRCGNNNVASGDYSTISGGICNTSSNCYSTISGGCCNLATGSASTISGGYQNNVSNSFSTVSGGYQNTASGYSATIGGGRGNSSSCGHSTISGGGSNTSSGQYSFIGGGSGNSSTAYGTVVGGGCINNASFPYATISGGYSNTASCDYATIGGGNLNCACNQYSVISGGYQALAYSYGQQTNASGYFAVVGDAQTSKAILRKSAILNSAQISQLFLDGVSEVLLPQGNNRLWNVMVKWAIVTTAVGAGTGNVGDVIYGTDIFFFKRVGGTGTLSTQTRIATQSDTSMATADIQYSVGASQYLQIDMLSPTTANGSTYRAIAIVYFEEVAW